MSDLDSDETFARSNDKAPSEKVEPIGDHLRGLKLGCDVTRCHNLATHSVQTYKKGHGPTLGLLLLGTSPRGSIRPS